MNEFSPIDHKIFGSFSGDLAIDSPSAKYLILKELGPSDFAELSVLYRQIALKGALIERDTLRKPKIRYNPKPARLVHILLSETEGSNKITLENAFNACCPQIKTPLELAVSQIDEESRYSLHFGALLLDQLRHFHMLPKVKQSTYLDDLMTLRDILDNQALIPSPRLQCLILTSLNRAIKSL